MDDYEDRPAISYESMYRALQKEVKQQKDMYKGVKYALDTSEQELADLNKAYDNLQDCHLQVCNEHESLKQLVRELQKGMLYYGVIMPSDLIEDWDNLKQAIGGE